VHFVGLYCTIILQCTVQKNMKYFLYPFPFRVSCHFLSLFLSKREREGERERATSDCRKLHNDYHHKRYSSPYYVWVIRLWWIKWHVPCVREIRFTYKTLVGRPQVRTLIWKVRCMARYVLIFCQSLRKKSKSVRRIQSTVSLFNLLNTFKQLDKLHGWKGC